MKEKLSIWRSTATRPIYDEEEEMEMEQKPSSSSRNMKNPVSKLSTEREQEAAIENAT